VVVEGFGLENEIGNEGRQWLGHQRGERPSRWRERRTIARKDKRELCWWNEMRGRIVWMVGGGRMATNLLKVSPTLILLGHLIQSLILLGCLAALCND
jgi:hypothetical protein